MTRTLPFLVALLLLVLAPESRAAELTSEQLAAGAHLCTAHLPRNERKYGIPQHLLSAISSTESGRWNDKLKIALPWPWTINTGGKGYYFNTKTEAIQFAQNLQAKGVKSMDVGCMQVNLHHHANAFKNLYEAFEPAYNVDYAARLLKSHYKDSGSWREAAAAYHSKTPSLGTKYVGNVYKSWQRLVARINSAVSSVGGAPKSVQVASFNAPDTAPNAVVNVSAPAKSVSTYKPIRMNVIEVKRMEPVRSTANVSMDHGVRVIRPTASAEAVAPAAAPREIADASFVENLGTKMNAIPTAAPAPRPGPKFIFN